MKICCKGLCFTHAITSEPRQPLSLAVGVAGKRFIIYSCVAFWGRLPLSCVGGHAAALPSLCHAQDTSPGSVALKRQGEIAES